ncbi:MAG: hypothetical protein AAF999_10790 [Pseudomonadota bacterium]
MPFIRPQAQAALIRWREALVGGAAGALGIWWLLGNSPLLLLPGAVLGIGGLALIWIGVQRARFRSAGQGPGTVQVDEGQITYFGPLTGGAVALRELTHVTLDASLYPAHWRLKQDGAQELLVPVNAAGAERLFDAFSTLPGFHMEQALAALRSEKKHSIVIWEGPKARAARVSLH